uniref:Uncharacterized protein n=1 Tax=Glossina pallidipes TaxID=7398 RepID=A0A1A9Z369_GLOPL
MNSTGNDDLIDVTKSGNVVFIEQYSGTALRKFFEYINTFEVLRRTKIPSPVSTGPIRESFLMRIASVCNSIAGNAMSLGFLRYCLAFIFDMNSSLIHFMPFYQMIVGYDSSQLITDGHNLIVIIIIINNTTLSSCSCIHTFCISSRRILQYIRLLKLFCCLRLSVRQLHQAFLRNDNDLALIISELVVELTPQGILVNCELCMISHLIYAKLYFVRDSNH